jgi:WD40 repeat protein
MFRDNRTGPLLIVAVLGVLAGVALPEPAAPADEDKGAVDFFGDPLPPGALARLGTTRMRQPEGVNGLAFSADGKTVIATGRGPTIHYWDPATGREVRSVQYEYGLWEAADLVDSRGHAGWHGFTSSHDGKLLALSARTNARLVKPSFWISLRDAATGKEIRQFANTRSPFHRIALSPDGKTLATTDSGSVVLWDTATGKKRDELAGQDGRVYCLDFSPDGDLLAAGGADGTVRFFDPARGKEVGQRLTHPRHVATLAFAPDGRTLATGSYHEPEENRQTGILTLWDVPTRKETGRLEGHGGQVHALAFTRDGKTLASAGADDTVRLWDVGTRKQLHRFGVEGAGAAGLAFAPDGRMLVAASGHHVRVWDVATGKEPAWANGHRTTVKRMAFSPDGKTLVSMAQGDGTLRVWDATTGREVRRFTAPRGEMRQLAFAQDQTLLTVGADNAARLWDVATGRERFRLGDGTAHDCLAAASPAGDLIAVADGKTLRLYAAQTGPEQRRLGDAATFVQGMAFSPDGKLLAVTHAGKRVDVWDVETAAVRDRLKGHGGPAHWLTFAGGPILVSLTEADGLSAHLWDVAAGKEGVRFKVGGLGPVLRVASSDGRFLAVADHLSAQLVLWDVTTGRKNSVCRGSRDWSPADPGINYWFHTVAFAPDGRTLVTIDLDGVMQLWEAGTGEEVRRWGKPVRLDGDSENPPGIPQEAAPGRFTGAVLAFSPDGRSVAVNDDDLILLWDVTGRAKPGGLPRLDLTPEEQDRLWDDLNQPHAAKAHRVLWALVAAGDPVVPFVLGKLRPRDAAARRIKQLVADLDSAEYAVRQAATKELEQIGLAAEPAMRGALANRPGLEMRRRLEGLLEKLELTGRVRVPRAVSVLEQVGTPSARQALEELAKGAPESRLTQEARSSLGRLAKRP